MALLGATSGLAGVLLARPLGLGLLGPSVFFGVVLAAYLWTKEVWLTPRLAGVVAASVGGSLVASFVDVVADFLFPIMFAPSASDQIHPLATVPGGLVQAGLVSLVFLTSLPKARGDLTLEIGGCTIAGAVLSIIGASIGESMLWSLRPIVAAVVWYAGLAFVLALAIERRTAVAASPLSDSEQVMGAAAEP